MAHLDKYTRQELRRILKETYREYDDPTKYENDVDIARTHLNYKEPPFSYISRLIYITDVLIPEIIVLF